MSKSFLKKSDKKDNTYLMYFSSCSLIYSRHVSMTTRNYVHIPEIFCSVLGLPTDGVHPMYKSGIFIQLNLYKWGLYKWGTSISGATLVHICSIP